MVSPSRSKERRNLPWFFIVLFLVLAIVIVIAFFMHPDFEISVNPKSISIQKGAFGTLWITLFSKNGFNSEVSFEISEEPFGVITTFDENQVTLPKDGSVSLIMSIKVSELASTGTSTLTITGKSDSLSRSVEFLLNVETPHGANIVSHTSYRDMFQHYYIVGEVQNNGQSNLRDIMITATLYDAENNVVATGFTYSMIDILLPDQKSPFEIYFEYSGPVNHYSLSSSYIETSEIPYRNFTLQDFTVSKDEDGFYHLKGKVNNTGTEVVYWAKVVATFYDSEGKVMMADFRYVYSSNPPAPFNPGTAEPFDLSTVPQKITPASYMIQVQGKVE